MPELPEVETTLRGIKPHLQGNTISKIIVRQPSLRWPVPVDELNAFSNTKIADVERRAKYLIIHTEKAPIMLHLGMSGGLRVLDKHVQAGKHDHIDICLKNELVLRFNDPRRFGSCLLLSDDWHNHALLAKLGPEPLSPAFNVDHLHGKSRGRSLAVKNYIMDGHVVVGVGNIYASEALFLAGIRPTSQAGKISKARYHLLVDAIKQVLSKAIEAGGTTLNDFRKADGKPGYFQQQLNVYGRADEPCVSCAELIRSKVIGNRNSYYCPACQSY